MRQQLGADTERSLAAIMCQSGSYCAIFHRRYPEGEETRDDNVAIAIDIPLEFVVAEDLHTICAVCSLPELSEFLLAPAHFPFGSLGVSSRRMMLGSSYAFFTDPCR